MTEQTPEPATDHTDTIARPAFSQFLAKALQDPHVQAAYEAALIHPEGTPVSPAAYTPAPESDYDRARHRIADLITPTGWRLGDVIASLVLDSGAVLPAPKQESAAGSRTYGPRSEPEWSGSADSASWSPETTR